MAKFAVTVTDNRTVRVVLEADNAEEARRIVEENDFDIVENELAWGTEIVHSEFSVADEVEEVEIGLPHSCNDCEFNNMVFALRLHTIRFDDEGDVIE